MVFPISTRVKYKIVIPMVQMLEVSQNRLNEVFPLQLPTVVRGLHIAPTYRPPNGPDNKVPEPSASQSHVG